MSIEINVFEIIQKITRDYSYLTPDRIEEMGIEKWGISICCKARIYLEVSNYSEAIVWCQEALKFINDRNYPQLFAEVNLIIGIILSNNYGAQSMNLIESISYLEIALRYFNHDTNPQKYLETLFALNKALIKLSEIKQEEEMVSIWGPSNTVVNEKLCFVLMPFSDPALSGVYEQIIKPIIKANGLIPMRGDNFKESTPIMADVWKGITTSRIIIADLTNFNANVYYELGLCHALNKRPILMVQKGQELPFDLRSFRTIFYSKELNELTKARQELDEFIKEALRHI